MAIRRVVTGHDASGQAVFASDTIVEAITVDLLPGFEFVRLWGADVPPAFPDDGSQPPVTNYFPPNGGFRFGTFTVPPVTEVDPTTIDIGAALVALETALPGMAAHMEPDAPGMHTTASVDYEYVVSGRVVLELDNGATVELGPGDTVIQNGTRHAWRNPFDEPCVMVVVLVGVAHGNVNH
jgi:mannose-6-phosphate isomerase-like protein (cupin superfamily)